MIIASFHPNLTKYFAVEVPVSISKLINLYFSFPQICPSCILNDLNSCFWPKIMDVEISKIIKDLRTEFLTDSVE